MINKVILMGRLTADPELRQTPNGISVCRFSIAVDRNFASKETGERQADFINIVTWRNTADFVAKYFSKGKMIIVEGGLRNDNYTDQNGVKHYNMNVQADNVYFGESKGASGGGNFGGYANNGGGYDNSQPQQYGNNNNSYQSAPAASQQPAPSESLQIGDLSDFEVLSDGDVPF